jgi:hypothetical protein
MRLAHAANENRSNRYVQIRIVLANQRRNVSANRIRAEQNCPSAGFQAPPHGHERRRRLLGGSLDNRACDEQASVLSPGNMPQAKDYLHTPSGERPQQIIPVSHKNILVDTDMS